MSTAIDIAHANGIVIAELAYDVSRAVGVPYWATCAFLMQESSGGHNVFGHDATIFVGAGEVTEAKYAAYKAERLRTGRCQGVGPMQLTFHTFQDEADALGGCWQPKHNLTEGLRILEGFVSSGKSWHQAAAAYNGSEAYADQMDGRFAQWQRLLGTADAAGPAADFASASRVAAAPESDAYARVSWRGHSFDKMTVAAILSAEQRLGYQIVITQGSYNTSVAASGQTHAGGGALDIHYDPRTSDDIVLSLRQTGFAAWRRFALANVWPDHIHAQLIGNAQASADAKKQWSDYKAGLDGLPPGVPSRECPDGGPRLSPIPVFRYTTEPEWPRLHTVGPEIAMMQRKLRRAGYYHGGDRPSYYGTHTRAAVRVFQLAQHWTGSDADGLLGPVTWARIQALTAEDVAA